MGSIGDKNQLFIDLIEINLTVKRVSKAELSRRTGISVYKIYHYLQGNTPIPENARIKLIKALGITDNEAVQYRQFKGLK